MQNPTTRQIIDAALAGNFKPFAEFYYLQMRAKLYHFILTYVKEKEVANDFVSDVYIRAQLNIEKYDFTCKLQSWLYTIAKNISIDYIRKSKKVSFIGVEEISAVVSSTETVKQSESFDLYAILRNMVDEMDDTRRGIIILRYWKQYSLQEISQEMSLPIGTVKGTLQRSKKVLYDKLKNHAGHSENKVFEKKI